MSGAEKVPFSTEEEPVRGLEFTREPPDRLIARPPQGRPATFRARPPDVTEAAPPNAQETARGDAIAATGDAPLPSSNGHASPRPTPPPRPRRSCEIPDCDRKLKAWGLCSGHLSRLKKYGDPMPDVPFDRGGGPLPARRDTAPAEPRSAPSAEARAPQPGILDPPDTGLSRVPATALARAITAAEAADAFDARHEVERARTALSRAQAWLLIHERLREEVMRGTDRGSGAGPEGRRAAQQQ